MLPVGKEALSTVDGPPPRTFSGESCSGNVFDFTELPPDLVLLNVYDVGDDYVFRRINEVSAWGSSLSMGGVFHGGVEVYGAEWGYGFRENRSGVSSCIPRANEKHKYRSTVSMGHTRLNKEHVEELLERLQAEWPGNQYDFIHKNCLSFCNAMCMDLGVGRIPGWVDRGPRAVSSIDSFSRYAVYSARRAAALAVPVVAEVGETMRRVLPWSAGGESTGGACQNVRELEEVVLECVHAEGVEIYALPEMCRGVAFRADLLEVPSSCRKVGRQHQPEFFERLVPKKKDIVCISRSHFELILEPPDNVPKVRKLTQNVLLVDDEQMADNDAVTVQEGTRLGFVGPPDSLRPFLVLRVALNCRAIVNALGPHPAHRRGITTPACLSLAMLRAPSVSRPYSGASAVLECTFASGSNLAEIPQLSKVILLPFSQPVEIGRSHQPEVFGELLRAEPQWLGFISRTHCLVQLSCSIEAAGAAAGEEGAAAAFPSRTSPGCTLSVENLSMNVVYVSGEPLSRGHGARDIREGGTIVFSAVVHGNDECRFIEFVLRRAAAVQDGILQPTG